MLTPERSGSQCGSKVKKRVQLVRENGYCDPLGFSRPPPERAHQTGNCWHLSGTCPCQPVGEAAGLQKQKNAKISTRINTPRRLLCILDAPTAKQRALDNIVEQFDRTATKFPEQQTSRSQKKQIK